MPYFAAPNQKLELTTTKGRILKQTTKTAKEIVTEVLEIKMAPFFLLEWFQNINSPTGKPIVILEGLPDLHRTGILLSSRTLSLFLRIYNRNSPLNRRATSN